MSMSLTEVFHVFGWLEWLALLWFFAAWIGYATFARQRAEVKGSLLASTNYHRRKWVLQTTYRDNRVIDGVVVQNMSTSPSFFASTTILIIGGLLALLRSSDQTTSNLVREIPFAALTSVVAFDLKVLLLIGIFVYAFFRFTWSLRQYSFGAILIASLPDPQRFLREEERREPLSQRAGRVMGLAAETFNDGLRAYYMAFAALLWFFSPIAFALGTAGIVFVLYRREFHSDVLALLRE